MLEQTLIRLYRRVTPRRMLHRVPSDTKDRLLRLWRFAIARPGPRLLWDCARAWAAWRDARRAAELWNAVALHWPGGTPPDLVRAAHRRALLVLAAGAQNPTEQAGFLIRALNDLAGPHELKTDTFLLAVLRDHVGAVLPQRPVTLAKDRLRRVVLCLDILKCSDGYTHARAVFAICVNLLEAAPDLEIDLVATSERRAAGGAPPGPDASGLEQQAGQALGPLLGRRFRLHVQEHRSLAAIVETCRTIEDMEPDLILFGGGHRGPVSNESRAVRHCLFDRWPVAFFFFQVSDQVDKQCDLIIARGPHRIEGNLGTVPVRVQTYPTLTAASPRPAPHPPRRADAPPLIVSAIAGARMAARLDELGQRNLARFLALLDERPGAIWHFIGSSDPARLVRDNRVLRARAARGQVVVHPVLTGEAFAALAGHASLFVHLPGFTGGSAGAGVARTAGVPILTFAHSDVAGRQPPETVFEDTDIGPCIALARRVLTDGRIAADIAARQAAYSAFIRDTAAQGFLDCLTEAHKRGVARLARSSRPSSEGD